MKSVRIMVNTDTKIRVLSLWGRGQCMFIFLKKLQLAYKKNNYRTTTKTKLVKQKTTTLKQPNETPPHMHLSLFV